MKQSERVIRINGMGTNKQVKYEMQLPRGCAILFWAIVIGIMVVTFCQGLQYCGHTLGSY